MGSESQKDIQSNQPKDSERKSHGSDPQKDTQSKQTKDSERKSHNKAYERKDKGAQDSSSSNVSLSSISLDLGCLWQLHLIFKLLVHCYYGNSLCESLFPFFNIVPFCFGFISTDDTFFTILRGIRELRDH